MKTKKRIIPTIIPTAIPAFVPGERPPLPKAVGPAVADIWEMDVIVLLDEVVKDPRMNPKSVEEGKIEPVTEFDALIVKFGDLLILLLSWSSWILM
jgi:hypothetical protein